MQTSITKRLWLYTILFLVPIILGGAVHAQGLIDDREIRIKSAADVSSKRDALVQYIWGNDGFPTKSLPKLPVIANDKSPIDGLQDLERVDTLMFEMPAGLTSYAHHFIPKVKNNKLVILHQGHLPTFDDSGISFDVGYGMRRTIEGLLGDGYSVLAVYMPRNVVFNTSISVSEDGGWDAHNEIFTNPKYIPKSGSQLKYFLEPVAAYLNYLSTRSASDQFPAYTSFSMVGFSGGGWTTTVYSAIDPRIKVSVSVAGSMPLYLRSGSIGDAEQTISSFYSIAGYPELYVLGSSGAGRRQVQILNRNDWCCFSQLVHDPAAVGGLSFDAVVREFESNVRNTLVALGERDLFTVEIDEAATGHTVTWDAIYDTILPELNDSRRFIGADALEVVSRGSNLSPLFFANGSPGTSKLTSMGGFPAVIRGRMNISDLFYRTSDNRLVHSRRTPANWSQALTVAEKAISDPSAASPVPGRIDVAVILNDYKVYHISRNGPTETIEKVTDLAKGLGRPTLIGTAPDQLDLFYRSYNRKLYHGRKVGTGNWMIREVGGRMVNFPTAVRLNDGTFRAYVRGLNGQLWEAQLGSGPDAQWVGWYSISGLTGAPGTIEGSPSAAVINGGVNVFVRTADSKIRQFTLNKTWSYKDHDGVYRGSPTASTAGVYVRTANGSVAFFDGERWKDLGGNVD
jgi:hypothetical protein